MNKKVKFAIQGLCLVLAIVTLSACTASLAQQAVEEQPAEQAGGPVKYKLTAPASVSAGTEFDVTVTFDIDSNWHIYAPTGNNAAQGMIETKVKYDLPEGIKAVGSLYFPEGEVLYGKGVEMVQTLQATKGLKAGKYTIKTKIGYQACNPQLCLPPVVEKITAIVEVK